MKIKVILAVSILILVLFCGCITTPSDNNNNQPPENDDQNPEIPEEPQHEIVILVQYPGGTGGGTISDVWGGAGIGSSYGWRGQSFKTGTVTSYVTGVSLYIGRFSGQFNPGDITVSIRSINNGYPLGSDIVSGTYPNNALVGSISWLNFNFSNPTLLLPNTEYAIVFNTPSESMNIVGKYGAYADGECLKSTNGGQTWTVPWGGGDYYFMVRGYT